MSEDHNKKQDNNTNKQRSSLPKSLHKDHITELMKIDKCLKNSQVDFISET